VTDYMKLASEHVIEHARYSNAKVPPAEPYFVRWPLTSGHLIHADDTMELVRKVARAMRRKDAAA
jgi:hypothetical protein